MSKEIKLITDYERHECRSWHEHGWIIFQCPTCSFARKLNIRTGEFLLLDRGDDNALHSGSHAPVLGVGVKPPAENNN